jgi:CheY-like chemotaxis protein
MAKATNIPAYYYPTKVYLVDDNKDFLTNFSLQLDPILAYSLFESPHEALRHLLQENKVTQLNKQVLTEHHENNENPISNQLVKLDLSVIHKQIFDQNRFEEVSVIVVDYDMPGLNGLELCKRLKDKPVKKILLTGKADEKLAISAFNEGLIHHFIQKNDTDIINRINESIINLQKQYFLDATKLIMRMLHIENIGFLKDPVFVELFNNICEDNNIVEYYITETTGSYLMLDIQSKPSWLVVKYYEDLTLHYEIAQSSKAPADVLESLRSGDKLPYSWNVKDYYTIEKDQWYKQLHPSEEILGKDTYYYSYITSLDSFDIKPGEILSYAKYLQQADINAL